MKLRRVPAAAIAAGLLVTAALSGIVVAPAVADVADYITLDLTLTPPETDDGRLVIADVTITTSEADAVSPQDVFGIELTVPTTLELRSVDGCDRVDGAYCYLDGVTTAPGQTIVYTLAPIPRQSGNSVVVAQVASLQGPTTGNVFTGFDSTRSAAPVNVSYRDLTRAPVRVLAAQLSAQIVQPVAKPGDVIQVAVSGYAPGTKLLFYWNNGGVPPANPVTVGAGPISFIPVQIQWNDLLGPRFLRYAIAPKTTFSAVGTDAARIAVIPQVTNTIVIVARTPFASRFPWRNG